MRLESIALEHLPQHNQVTNADPGIEDEIPFHSREPSDAKHFVAPTRKENDP
jgi:hypothetical protein